MPTYDEALLSAARLLISRRAGRRGKLPSARVRRSVSTSYYAIFHFLIEGAGSRLIGSSNGLRRRRRMLARTFTHKGIKTTLDKVRGANIDVSVADFLRTPGAAPGPVPSPAFARSIAKAFSDAQARRHDADYDLNAPLSEADARLARVRVKRAIADWRNANTAADKDFKHSVCMLMLLKGQLRRDD